VTGLIQEVQETSQSPICSSWILAKETWTKKARKAWQRKQGKHDQARKTSPTNPAKW